MYSRLLSNLSCLLFVVLLLASNAMAQQSPIEQQVSTLVQNGASFHQANAVFTALPDLKFPQSDLDRSAQRLRLNQAALFSLMSLRPDYLTLTIPYGDQTITLDLYQQNILSPSFNVRTGDWQKTPYSPGVYYRGIIRGAAGSLAAISFFDNEIIGVLAHREWGNMNLGRKETQGNETEYVLFEERLLPIQPSGDCGTEEKDQTAPPPKTLSNPEVSGCVTQFFEADYALYLDKGSVQNTVNYVTGFFNAVATIYNNETVSIALAQVYVWTVQDPYDYSSSATALSTFGNYRTNFEGELAHLTSLEGNTLGGRAVLDVICASGNNYAYSGIYNSYQNYPTYSWTVYVVAHEMGHNFSSRHTHWCGWPGGAIDNCAPTAGYGYETPPSCSTAPTPTSGTIMSYCHLVGSIGINFTNGFGPHPGDAIRAGVTTALASTCITANCPTYTCNAPTEISYSSVTNTTASVSWNTIGGATGYNLQYRVSPAGAWTTVGNINPPYVLMGLSPSTVYEVQVQTICSGATLSRYYTGAIFQTNASACAEPSALSAAPLSNTSMSLDWVENGTATTWEIQWGLQGFALGSGTIVATSAHPYTLSGLSAATNYAFYVRATCGGSNGNSTWVGPYNFNTPSGNDLSQNAIELILGQLCSGNTYNNTAATLSANEFSPDVTTGGYWNTPANQTVWFWFTAPASGSVHISTDFSPQGSNDDTQIALYNTATPTSINHLLVSNEDGGNIGNTYNTYSYYSGLTAGSPYYIQVDGWDNVEGSFCIEVHENFNLPEPGTCTAYTQTSVNGATAPTKWYNIYTKPNGFDIGLPVAAIRSSSNLGTVTIREILQPLPILSTSNGVKYMQRYYAVTNSSNTGAARDIRLFYTNSEFTDFANAFAPPSTATTEDLNISRYNQSTFNCAPTDNTGSGNTITSVATTPIGTSGYFYLQFNSGQGEYAAILGSTPLPVELISFDGVVGPKGNTLFWTTELERNIVQFAIERSENGNNSWKTIGEAIPKGHISNTYNFSDDQPLAAAYYRLACYESDGAVQYSNIIYLQRPLPEGITAIAPNPAQDRLYISYYTTQETEVLFQFYSSDGRLMQSQMLDLGAGDLILPFDIGQLPPGLYYCTTNQGKGLPFVKQ